MSDRSEVCKRGCTHDANEHIRRSIVVQLVFVQRHFRVEQYWIRSRELSKWDDMRWVVCVCCAPDGRSWGGRRILGYRRVCSRVCGGVRPIIRLCLNSLWHQDGRSRFSPVWSSEVYSYEKGMVSDRLLSQASAYPTLTPPSPSSKTPFLTCFRASLVLNECFHPDGRCSKER